MKRDIQVFVGDSARKVGTLRFNAEGARESAIFEYAKAWLEGGDTYAVSPQIPLISGPQFHKKSREGSTFHSVIADTEPDGWGRRVILRDHAKTRKHDRSIAALTSLDFLLAVDDQSRVGALRFADESGTFQRAPNAPRRTTPPLIELSRLAKASHKVESQTETDADLAYLRGRGTSLGGMRPKCTVIDTSGHLSIGKFPSIADDRAVTKGEILALRLAKDAGLNAAYGELVSSDGVPVALIRRFDRINTKRVLYVSAATMLGVEATGGAEASYADIADAIRQHGASADADIEELWRRVAFSILITNVDDHLLNHGFLHAGGGLWRLAPAFDVNPFPDRARELKTWLSPQIGPSASIEALYSVADYFRINAKKAKAIVREVDAAVAHWRKRGKELGMTPRELDAFADAFEHEERL